MFNRLTFRLCLTLALVSGLSACAKVQYLDQALTLQAYSQERAALDAEVASRDALFEELLLKVKSGEAQASIRTARELRAQFGEPVLKLDVKSGERLLQEWVYRCQVRFFDFPKVYVMVEGSGEIAGFRIEKQ